MTPKEKAEELVTRYRKKIISFLSDNMKEMNAKECALIAVDEIINLINSKARDKTYELIPYWEKVKQEIEKL